MPIDADRLKSARAQKGWSQAELARKAGVSQQTIGKLENGSAKTSKFITRIAAALEVDVATLDPDYGPSDSGVSQGQQITVLPSIGVFLPPMPLYASAEQGDADFTLLVSAEVINYVTRPYPLEHVKDAYGILVEGESMSPAFEAGDTAWVNPLLGPRKDVDVVIYARAKPSKERRATIRRLLSWTETHWTVRQHKPERTYDLARGEWETCHRIIGKLSKP